MPIMFRSNPMPTTGALYVTNPRKKKIQRRDNGPKDRMISRKLGIPLARVKAMKSTDYKKYQEMYKKAGGADGLKKYKVKGTKVRKAVKDGTYAHTTWGPGKTKEKSSSKKASSRKTAQKKKTTRLSADQRNAAMKIAARSSVTSQTKFVAAAKKSRDLKDLTQAQLKEIYNRLQKLNPAKRRNAMAVAKRKTTKRKTSKKLGSWKGRMMKYTTFSKRLAGCGLTAKQKSALWKKYKKTGKLPALAQAKKHKSTVKARVASRRSSAGLSSWQKLVKKHGVKKASKLYKKQKSKSPAKKRKATAKKRKASSKKATSAWMKLVKKHGVIKASKMYKKPSKAASKQRKTKVVRKARAKTSGNTYVLYMRERKRMRGGATSGLSHMYAKQDYKVDKPKIDKLIAKGKTKLQAVKQVLKGKHGLLKRDKRFKVGGRPLRKTPGAGVRSTIGKYPTGAFTRLNPLRRKNFALADDAYYGAAGAADAIVELKPFAAIGSLFNGLGDMVADLPVVDRLAPYVRPAGMMATTAATMGLARHYVAPHVVKALPMLAQYQQLSGTLLGGLTALSIGLAQKLGVADSSSAASVGYTALALGLGMDIYEFATKSGYVPNYFRSNIPVAGIAMSGYGDGGQYYVAPIHRRVRSVPTSGAHADYGAIVAPLSGAAGTSGAPMGYGALMYTGSGY